jgi:starch synthase (maltosyl-transferring)
VLESEPVPGKEEYQDSEKYQIRVRDWSAPNIIPEITRLNMIRKGHPALHSHLGVTFLPAFNDNVLFFEKASPAGDDVLLIAISLDPHNVQEADLELPLWRWGLPDDAAVEVQDLVFENRFTLYGKHQHIRLDPDHPYAIWSILTPRSPAP